MRRLISLLIAATLMLIVGGSTFAADAPFATPHPKKATRHHARARATESAAARREREHREDLERRVERLEQQNEMKEPTMPPPDSPR